MIRYLASNLVELVAPLDESVSPLAPIVAITSCVARLYDAAGSFVDAPSTPIVEEIDVGELELQVANALGFQVGATVEATQVDGKVHRTTIAAIASGATLADPDSITLVAAPVAAIAPNEPLRQVSYLAGATVLFVRHPERFSIGDTVALRDAAAARVTFTVSAIGRRHLVLGAATAGVVNPLEGIERKLGADVVMAGYNLANAALATDDWGYRGTVLHTHADLKPGILVAVEVELITATVRILERLTLPVLGR